MGANVPGGGLHTSCNFSVALPLLDASTSDPLRLGVPVHATFAALMSQCPAADPVAGLVHSVAGQVAPIPFRVAAQTLGGATLPGGIEMRPSVMAVLYTAANATGRLLGELLSAQADDGPLNCAAFNGVAGDVRAVMCCDVLPPLFWFVSAWYLMAWAMCLCGLPAACLGRKRFAPEPWGAVYEDSLAAPGGKQSPLAAGAGAGGTAARRRAGGRVGNTATVVALDGEGGGRGSGGYDEYGSGEALDTAEFGAAAAAAAPLTRGAPPAAAGYAG